MVRTARLSVFPLDAGGPGRTRPLAVTWNAFLVDQDEKPKGGRGKQPRTPGLFRAEKPYEPSRLGRPVAPVWCLGCPGYPRRVARAQRRRLTGSSP